MIGDILQVKTRNSFSSRGDTLFRDIVVEGRFGHAVVTENMHGPHGTTIRVRLNNKNRLAANLFLSNSASYIRSVIRRPQIPVIINLPPSPFTIDTASFLSLKQSSYEKLSEINVLPVVIDLERWSNRIKGYIILFFFQSDSSVLSHRKEQYKPEKIQAYQPYLLNFHGNRITVNGITMISKNIGTVLGKADYRITGAIDVEMTGTEDIQYDVSRDRLVGQGILIARDELKTAITKSLKELGYYSRFDDETKKALDYIETGRSTKSKIQNKPRPIDNEEILNAVLSVIPKDKWPLGLHRIIAEKLEISPSIAYRSISTLIDSGRLIKPDSNNVSETQ